MAIVPSCYAAILLDDSRDGGLGGLLDQTACRICCSCCREHSKHRATREGEDQVDGIALGRSRRQVPRHSGDEFFKRLLPARVPRKQCLGEFRIDHHRVVGAPPHHEEAGRVSKGTAFAASAHLLLLFTSWMAAEVFCDFKDRATETSANSQARDLALQHKRKQR